MSTIAQCTVQYTVVLHETIKKAPSYNVLCLHNKETPRRLHVLHCAASIICRFVLLFEYIPARERSYAIFAGRSFFAVGAVLAAGSAALLVPIVGWRWFLVVCAIPFLLAFFVGFVRWDAIHFIRSINYDIFRNLKELYNRTIMCLSGQCYFEHIVPSKPYSQNIYNSTCYASHNDHCTIQTLKILFKTTPKFS